MARTVSGIAISYPAPRGAHPLPPEVIRGYGDPVTAVATAAATGTLALVRPDAYVAWAADASGGTGKIRDTLARWCGASA